MANPKILVVEDDPIVLMVSALAFREAGLAIVEAESADDAIGFLRAIGDEVAVVFSDIETPGELNGIGLARAIRERWPAIPVVLTSGHVVPAAQHLEGCTFFVPKPYDPERVSAVLRQLARDPTCDPDMT